MYEVVIVGGGISGLYLHSKLIKRTKNILLLEQNDYFGGRILQHTEKVNGVNVSIPAGAARFNKNHTEVIKLLKEYHLLDFRKDKGIDSSINFIDTKNEFSNDINKKNGFHYINKILNLAKKEKEEVLKKHCFSSYAAKYLSQDELDYMLIASGYSGQLKYMNAFDACNLFANGIRTDITYYGGYYHLLIENIVKELKKQDAHMKLKCVVKDFKYDHVKSLYTVFYNNQKIYTKHLLLCIPKPSLLQFEALHPIHSILKQSVQCKKLCRVYALFNKEDIWFQNLKKTVVNNPLRYIIPFDAKKGIIMISYTDDEYTNFWMKIKNDQTKLKKQIVKYIEQSFQIKVNAPEKVWVFDWNCGVAYWKPNKDSLTLSNYIINPLPNLYICGENYSMNQSWVEGALETSNKCLEKINI